jgi:mono/diheme cytochrome c family protein
LSHRFAVVLAIGVSLSCSAPLLAQEPLLYTAGQAKLGTVLYARQCAACHGAQLEGGAGPALTGDSFRALAATQHLTPAALLDVISKTMPMTSPGSLRPDDYASLVAFILQRAGYPAGSEPLMKGNSGLTTLNLGLDSKAGNTAPVRTASDGIYSEAQAAQGKALYADNCLMCHGGELEGVEDAPPLAGKPFMAHWGGLPVGTLHGFIDRNMPPGNGGMLGAVAESKVVAYILSKNQFRAGPADLPADPAGLGIIVLK